MKVFATLTDRERHTVITRKVPFTRGYFVPAHRIAMWGSLEDLVTVIQFVDDIETKDGIDEHTILTSVVSDNDRNKVLYILERGADVNVGTKLGDTPAHIAAMNRFEDAFEALLKSHPNLDAVTMYLDNPMSVHDMIATSSNAIRRSAVKYLLQIDALTPAILGKCLLPLVARGEYGEIVRIFDLGVTGGVDASSFAKASAYLRAVCIRLEVSTTYDIDAIVRYGALDAIRIHIASSTGKNVSFIEAITQSPIPYEIIVLLHGTGTRINARHWRMFIEDGMRRCEGVEGVENRYRSLRMLEWFCMSLCIKGYDRKDDDLPTLRDVALANLRSLEAKESNVLLYKRIALAQFERNWTLIFK
jgi:hypothetical protein